MFDTFKQHESAFNDWIMEGYPGIKEETREFIENLMSHKRERRLWKHQEKAILRLIFTYEKLGMKNVLLNIVTGGGKTLIIAAIIAWLRMAHGINKFLIIVPNLIVRDRLEDDFKDKKVFKNFQLFPPIREDYLNELDLHTLESGSGPHGMTTAGIVLGNIQQFYSSNISGQRNVAWIMNFMGEISIFNDEAHNTPAPEYTNVLSQLSKKCLFRLDTTATPDRADGQTPDSDMIYHYDISQALDDKIIKSIVVYEPEVKATELTYTNPKTNEKRVVTELDRDFEEAEKHIKPFQWVLDTEPMKKQMKIALDRLEEQKRRSKERYKPVLFVVTMSIREGEKAQKILQETFKVNTLLVTEESDEKDRVEARLIGTKESKYDAVVSVMMLREGWDVPEVAVILLLRKFSSPVYGQQVIGRGLRRIIRNDIEPEILAVIDHPKLQHEWLWRLVAVSKIRQGVLPDEIFGDEDLPEKPKIQRLTKPENFIVIPSPEYETKIDFEKKREEISEDEVEQNWREILNTIEYDRNEWRITKTKVEEIKAKHLDKSKTMEVIREKVSVEDEYRAQPQEMTKEELQEKFKQELLSIASGLLLEAGFGGMKKGKLYSVMMDHIVDKLFKGKSLAEADKDDIEFALDNMETIRKNFTKAIVAGILQEM